MERSARLGSLLPYRKAAEVMAEFLPIKRTESFVTLRYRTLKLGERLDERARERAWFEPPSTAERRRMELNLPNDPEREFVVSIDTAHVRASRPSTEAAKAALLQWNRSLRLCSTDKAIWLLNLDLPADFHETLRRNVEQIHRPH